MSKFERRSPSTYKNDKRVNDGTRKLHNKLKSTAHVEPEAELVDNTPEEVPSNGYKRASKHAPQEISAKKAVPWLRQVVDVPKIERRDPRFENLAGKFDDTQFRKNYAFLNEYREQEMKDLEARIAKSKNFAETAQMQKEYQSLESKLNAAKRKDFERQVVREHEKKERELVKQGKTPFYLKKADKKKLILTKRFSEMKKSEVAHAIQRRRKKITSKERKQLPRTR
ncbi:hypothetical protein V1512DRAFT_292294, partial [Lipomyces arxii]|uniref:uncharacterized protein n=1 Tax=Lipomyces arxii TaxID=56418 RepID=UPI0034CE7D1B